MRKNRKTLAGKFLLAKRKKLGKTQDYIEREHYREYPDCVRLYPHSLEAGKLKISMRNFDEVVWSYKLTKKEASQLKKLVVSDNIACLSPKQFRIFRELRRLPSNIRGKVINLAMSKNAILDIPSGK